MLYKMLLAAFVCLTVTACNSSLKYPIQTVCFEGVQYIRVPGDRALTLAVDSEGFPRSC